MTKIQVQKKTPDSQTKIKKNEDQENQNQDNENQDNENQLTKNQLTKIKITTINTKFQIQMHLSRVIMRKMVHQNSNGNSQGNQK